MRKISEWLIMCCVALSMATFAACSDDDKEAEPLTNLFDEPLKIRCEAGSVVPLDFNSPVAWQAVSGAIWCSLSADGTNFSYNVSGNAGNSRIYITVNTDAQMFEETTSSITLVRGSQQEHIATVYRSAKGYELKLIDAKGNVCDTILITSKGTVDFSVEANFDFGVSEKPVWIDEFTVTTDAENPMSKNFRMSVSEERMPFPGSATIEFMNNDGSVTYPYTINFTGMEPDIVRISGAAPWGWTLSSDGTIFSTTSISGEKSEYDGSVPYTVTTLNHDCRYLCFELHDSTLQFMQPTDSWIKVATDRADASKVFVSGEPYPAETEGERTGYIFAVPAASYDDFMAMFNSVNNLSFIDSTYNNVLMEITQISDYVDLSKGFTIINNMAETIECFPESDTLYTRMLKEKYNLDEVFAVSVDAGNRINAFTHLTDRHWEGWNSDNTLITDADGNEIEKSSVGFEVAMDASDNYYFSLTASSKPMIIILRGVDGKYLKALVVKSGITLDPGTGFVVKYKMIEDVECTLETDMELAAAIIERHGTREIYSVTTRVGRTLQMFPHLTDEEWGGGNYGSTLVFDTDGNEMDLADVNLEVAMDSEDNYYVSSKVKKKPYLLVFVGLDGKNIKAIVIKPQS